MRRLPISRLANLTPLDQTGLPVWSAITPCARDLTTHLGKGATHQDARVSALMEAVERCSAEGMELPSRRISLNELIDAGEAALDPRRCDLPVDTRFSADARFNWVSASDLVSGGETMVPIDLAVSPPREGILHHVDTNGLASGNSVLEATVHALAEVIERDAISQDLFIARHLDSTADHPICYRIDPGSWPLSSVRLAERLMAHGLDVRTDWLATDIGVPTFRVLVIDHEFPCRGGTREHGFVGYGTAPDPELALQRSMTEAVQSRLAVIQGARDAFNRYPSEGWDSDSRKGSNSQPLLAFDTIQGFRSINLDDDLNWLCQKLQAAGFTSILRIDLTRTDLDIPVVRVRVPGLSCFVVNQRRIGWRCLRHLL
jgi:ribosomal protein S12 methylthiotransferase accessory factor